MALIEKRDITISWFMGLGTGIFAAVLLVVFQTEGLWFLGYLACLLILMAISLLRHSGLMVEVKSQVFRKEHKEFLVTCFIASVGLGFFVAPRGESFFLIFDMVLRLSFLWAVIWISFKEPEISKWRQVDQGDYWQSIFFGGVFFYVPVAIALAVFSGLHKAPEFDTWNRHIAGTKEAAGWFVRLLYIVVIAVLSTASVIGLLMMEAVAQAQKASQEIVAVVREKLSAAGITPTKKNVDLYISEGADEVRSLAAQKAEEIGMPAELILLSGKPSFIDRLPRLMAFSVAMPLFFPYFLTGMLANGIKGKHQPEAAEINTSKVLRGLRLF